MLYLRTKQSEVWICRAGQGPVYYYGHRFSPDDELLLTDVRRQGEEYVATNASADRTTVYRVSRDELVIDDGDGEPEVQPAVGAAGHSPASRRVAALGAG